jgi:hypothetical protein
LSRLLSIFVGRIGLDSAVSRCDVWISPIMRAYFVMKREVTAEAAVEIEGRAGRTGRDHT